MEKMDDGKTSQTRDKRNNMGDNCDTESTGYVIGSMYRWVGIKQGVRQGGVLSGFYIVCLLMIC